MATKHPHPRKGHPLSRAELRKFNGQGALYEFLDYYAQHDTFFRSWDFEGDAFGADFWAVANGGGAAAVSFATNVQRSGVIRATTGTANDATASSSIISPAIYYGDANCGCEFHWKPITAVTETRIEQGFVDVVPSSNASVVATLITPTVNASIVDAAVQVYNHTGSTTTNQLTTIGTTIAAVKTTYTPPVAIAATTYNWIRLQLLTNQVLLWMDGVLVAKHNDGTTNYIEGGSALALFAYIRANNATSKSLDLDFVGAWQDR